MKQILIWYETNSIQSNTKVSIVEQNAFYTGNYVQFMAENQVNA